MQNEYGAALDRNGYAPSIVQAEGGCYICGTQNGKIDRHEPFGGGYRQKSKRLGLWVLLCRRCHTDGEHAAHRCRATADRLRADTQTAAMQTYGWDTAKIISELGGNYL